MTNSEIYLTEVLQRFIREMETGKRLQKNGKRITKRAISNYKALLNLLNCFEEWQKTPIRLRSFVAMKKRARKREVIYWKKFFRDFMSYLHKGRGLFDNYTGSITKLLRSFMNYLEEQKEININSVQRRFYVRSEAIRIIVLSPERLRFLINDKTFEESLNKRFLRTKDAFLLGCVTALRFSDLMRLTRENIETENGITYLSICSQKTKTYTKTRLPDFMKAILRRARKGKRTLFRPISLHNFNKSLKQLCEKAGWTEQCIKSRERQGETVILYKDKEKKQHYRFCDQVSSHTMRRTAITTYLSLGMDELAVRHISGHKPGSKEFFRYVAFSQAYIDDKITEVHRKLELPFG